MALITSFSQGQQTIDSVLQLWQRGNKETAMAFLCLPRNGIPKLIRQTIVEEFSGAKIEGLREKCLELLGDSKNTFFIDPNLFGMLISLLPKKSLRILKNVCRIWNTHCTTFIKNQLQEKTVITLDEWWKWQRLLGSSAKVGPSLCNLRILNIEDSSMSFFDDITYKKRFSEIISQLPNNCNNLKILNLRSVFYQSFRKQEPLVDLASRCSYLDTLILSDCSHVKLDPFVDKCSNITHLDLSHTRYIDAPSLKKIVVVYTNLAVLNLRDIRVCDLSEFSSNLPSSLESLNLVFSQVKDDDLTRLSKRCYNLRSLNLNYCCAIKGEDEGLQELSHRCTRLSNLALPRDVSAKKVVLFLEKRSLESLKLDCTHYSEDDFRALIPKLSSLTYLKLNPATISEERVSDLLFQNTQIVSLGLDCKHYGHVDFSALIPKLSSLTYLRLYSAKISKESFRNLLLQNTQLQNLHLRGSTLLKYEISRIQEDISSHAVITSKNTVYG